MTPAGRVGQSVPRWSLTALFLSVVHSQWGTFRCGDAVERNLSPSRKIKLARGIAEARKFHCAISICVRTLQLVQRRSQIENLAQV